MLDEIRTDIQRLIAPEKNLLAKLGGTLVNLGLHAVLLYRLSRWLWLHRLRPFAVVVSYFNSVFTGAQLSPRAVIGKGLVIYHPHGTVIGAGVVIGDYCTLVHGNVIGQHFGEGDRPVIGDDFYAGTGAKMLGRIRIGDRVRVGANAVVVKSLPDGAVVRTTPLQRISGFRSSPRVPDDTTRAFRYTILDRLVPLLKATVDMLATENMPATDSITESTVLLGEGLDLASVEVLCLIGAIEEEFNLTVDDDEVDISHFKTVGSLVSFIQERLPA